MKKLLRSKKPKEQPSRITNETVAEHRERILAGGRRFKYPVQYARHRLVFNTILISVIALIVIVALVGWQLYPQQNSSTFFYRITRVLPLPVASVDGQSVPMSSYLLGYRASRHYLETKEGINLDAPDSKGQVDYIKRKALNDAIDDSYAAKVAKERGISVSNKQIDDAIAEQRQSRDGLASKETYDAIVLDHYGWTPDEAREDTGRKLLRQEVSYALDDNATSIKDKVVSALQKEQDFDKVVASLGNTGNTKVKAGVTSLVPRINHDGGLAEMAATLKKGQISSAFKSTSGDGYYIVKLLDTDNDSRISYGYIQIPLTAFSDQLKQLREQGKISEYISVPAIKTQPVTQ